jgi:hypothetical protein
VVSAPRVSIEDGAFLKGSLDVRKTGTEPVVLIDLPTHALETPKALLVRSEIGNRRVHRSLQPA